MSIFMIRKRAFIFSTTLRWWLISIGTCGLISIDFGKTLWEKFLNGFGLTIFLVYLWVNGGVAFKRGHIGLLRVYYLLHPPFIFLWPANKVICKVLTERTYAGIKYMFDPPIECEAILLKPWPLCFWLIYGKCAEQPAYSRENLIS